MPPLPADSIHARACKLKCEKILTRPLAEVPTGVSAVFVFAGKTVAFMRRRCYETEHE